MVAVEVREYYAGRAKERQREGGSIGGQVSHGKVVAKRAEPCREVKSLASEQAGAAGVEPRYKEVSLDDPVAYVLSNNLHRRHLTTSQASLVAAKAETLQAKLSEEAKERQKVSQGRGKKGKGKCPDLLRAQTRDQLGEQFGVSGRNVERARVVPIGDKTPY